MAWFWRKYGGTSKGHFLGNIKFVFCREKGPLVLFRPVITGNFEHIS